MSRFETRVAAILMSVAFLATVFGPTSSTQTAEAAATQTPVTLYVGVTQTVDSLNPFEGYLSMSYEVYTLMYEMLVGVDKDLNPTPQIAESWEVSPDGLVWTYHIRHGMTWHDGEAVTADDVNYTYNLIMSNEAAGALSLDYLRNVTDCRALDEYTLRITTEVPKATMLTIVIPIVPEHVWSAIPADRIATIGVFDPTYFPDGPVGSGPFKLVQYETDDFVKFEAYDDYYGDTVNFDELIYKIYLETQTMLTEFVGGTIDIACYVPANSWETVLGEVNIDGQAVDEIVLSELGLNVCPPELRVSGASQNYELMNLSVRQAINTAVDRDALVEDVLLGLGAPGDVLIPPASLRWHYNLTAEERMDFNIDDANAILDAAGYSLNEDTGIRENGTSGEPLEFLFYYINDNKDDETMAYQIADWLEQIGISAPPMGVSETALINYWMGMKYDMFIWGWGGDADPSFLLSVMTTDQIPSSKTDWAAWSDCFYSNPVYDNLFIAQQNAIDVEDRQDIIYEMQRILYRDSPYIVLNYPYGLYAYRTDRFTNWPRMDLHPGMTPMTGLTGGPWLYFEIVPVGDNLPPQDVSAGEDTQVALNEIRNFTGTATDETFETLNWTWEFTEPDSTTNMRYGQTVSYKFENVGEVSVTLTVTDDGGLEADDDLMITVVEIEDAGWLLGQVTSTSDEPIIAASVTAGASSATTDVNGMYNMTLAAGVYEVTADAEGYQAASDSVTVVEGQEVTLDFALVSTSGTLVGSVVDADTGDPIDGAVVTARLGDFSKLAGTDEGGDFTIALLEPGEYTVTVAKEGYETYTTAATIVVGQDTTLEIELSKVEESGGIAALAIVAALLIAAVVVIAAVLLLKRKGKGEGSGGEPPEAQPPASPPPAT